MAAADRQHIIREERRLNLRMNDGVHSMNVVKLMTTVKPSTVIGVLHSMSGVKEPTIREKELPKVPLLVSLLVVYLEVVLGRELVQSSAALYQELVL